MATYDVTNETFTRDFTSILKANDVIECNYSGTERSVVLPDGIYIFECYGAQGGNSVYSGTASGGYGAKTKGTITLYKSTLYFSVGGKGNNGSSTSQADSGGWNGGGASLYYGGGSGGGATHIATRSGLLKNLVNYKSDILMVAGAGGGAARLYSSDTGTLTANGGAGGQNGSDGKWDYAGKELSTTLPSGGTQSQGGSGGGMSGTVGEDGGFGFGGASTGSYSATIYGGAGGAGYYGGGGGAAIRVISSRQEIQSGAGGSSYVNQQFTEVSYTSGSRSGNGYIVITAIEVGSTPLIYIKTNSTLYKISDLYCQPPGLGIKQVKEAYIKQNGVIHKLQ